MRLLIASALLLFPLIAAEPSDKESSVIIDGREKEYTVQVGGTLDPENVEIVFENMGTSAVKNPRMTVNGLYDWYDANAIVAEATQGCKTDEEKAIALWQWVLYKRYQLSPADRSALHPVRAMNGYGYGICGHTSAWLKCLWKAAGVSGRVQELWGHTISEAYWDGGWHLLDGNVKVFYLARDNRSIASLETLEKDGGLIERGIHPRDPWERRPDTPDHNRELVNYIVTAKDNYVEESYDGEIAKNYTMAMTLRPGEKLVRWWEPRLAKSERGDGKPPQRYANGQLVWEPDLKSIDIRPYLSIPHWGNIATRTEDGRGPAVHVRDLQDKLYTRPAVFAIPVRSAYPIVGGRFQGTLVKEGSSSLDLMSVFFGPAGWRRGDLFQSSRETRTTEADIDLDPNFKKSGVVYNYEIGFAMTGNAEARPPTQSGLDRFRLVTDLQVSPHSLPALALGKNTIRFWHETGEPVKLRITHRWREVADRRPPAAVEAAVSPRDGQQVAGLAPTLTWTAAKDPDPSDKVVDYQVMVCARPDCKWPLSPSLCQSVGSDRTEWTVPATFLNPGTTYYWRVRARDNRGDIGGWSRIFRFSTSR